MPGVLFQLGLSFGLWVVLLADLLLKFRRGFLVGSLRDWGFLSPVDLCFVGGVSAYIVGFPGWVLLFIAAIVSTSLVRFLNPVPDVEQVEDTFIQRNRRFLKSNELQAYFLVASELVCCGFVLSRMVSDISDTVRLFLG